MAEAVHVGIDLAWSTGTTGLAAVDDAGRLLTSTSVTDDEQISAWLTGLSQPPRVVAVDAPLIVPNKTGQRRAERLMAQTFGRYGASAHSANRSLLGDDPRALRLARRYGWTVDPRARPHDGRTRCIEVYPHPALIGLFDLPYRLAYKKGAVAERLPAFTTLLNLLETVGELRLTSHPRWQHIREAVDAGRPGVLSRYEDEVDGIVCAHVAWLWEHKPETLHVYGSLAEGYIVAPPPPAHPPMKPPPAPRPTSAHTPGSGSQPLRTDQPAR